VKDAEMPVEKRCCVRDVWLRGSWY